MKSIIKWIIIISTFLIFLYAFSTSCRSQNIDNLDYVIAIGIDAMPDSDNLEISFEFANPSFYAENSSEDYEPIIDTVSASSISSAVNILNAYMGKQVNLSHCKIVIFSEEVAKKGILSEVAFLMNDTQVRPTTNILVSSGNAKEYIKNSVSSLEKAIVKYYDIFPASAEYTGYTSNVLLSHLYSDIINKDSGAVSILGMKSDMAESSSDSSKQSTDSVGGGDSNSSSGGSSSSEQSSNSSSSSQSDSNSESGKKKSDDSVPDKDSIDSILPGEAVVQGDRGTENMGLCVFKDDKYVGKLSAIETLCFSLISNEVDSFMVSIDDPFEPNKKIDLSVNSLSYSSIDVDVSKDNPSITVKLKLNAKGLTGQTNLDYYDAETLDKLNSSFNDYLCSQIKSYLEKTSKEYQCDLNGFYNHVKKKFATTHDYQEYNWSEKYKHAEFNVVIDSVVMSGLLLQNSQIM